MELKRVVMGAGILLAGLGVTESRAQSPVLSHPIGFGEELSYQVRSNRFGKIGSAQLRVGGPDTIRGVPVYRLEFDLKGRVGPFNIEDRTRSWVDPQGFVSLRYEKNERHPLSSRSDAFDLLPEEKRWTGADGSAGAMLSEEPLDELSFIYLVRLLDFSEGGVMTLDRHYHMERNPVRIELVGRESVALPVGLIPTLVVELQVRDERRFNGSGLIRIHLTDDAHRYPVRIETALPMAGTMVLELESLTPARQVGAP